jgi:hypothetical protein
VLTVHAAPHPNPKVQRIGFELCDTCVELKTWHSIGLRLAAIAIESAICRHGPRRHASSQSPMAADPSPGTYCPNRASLARRIVSTERRGPRSTSPVMNAGALR